MKKIMMVLMILGFCNAMMGMEIEAAHSKQFPPEYQAYRSKIEKNNLPYISSIEKAILEKLKSHKVTIDGLLIDILCKNLQKKAIPWIIFQLSDIENGEKAVNQYLSIIENKRYWHDDSPYVIACDLTSCYDLPEPFCTLL
jgi:hypothetical protein